MSSFKRRDPGAEPAFTQHHPTQTPVRAQPVTPTTIGQDGFRPVVEGPPDARPCLDCAQAWPVEQLTLGCTNDTCENRSPDISKDPPVCVGCGSLAEYFCPTCKNPISPLTVEQLRNAVILVGARNSGKSVYLATLLQEMKRLLPRFGISVSHPDHVSDRAFAACQSEVVVQRRLPGPTVFNKAKPLHVRLERRRSKSADAPIDAISLVLYDPPGEIFEEEARTRRGLVSAARGVILLVDAAVAYKAPADTDSALQVTKRDMEAVRKAHLDHRGLRTAGIKLAVTLSKIDVIMRRERRLIDPGVFYDRRSREFSLNELRQDRDKVDAQVRKALESLEAGNLVQLAENHFDTKYFGVSSLGTAPLKVKAGPGADWTEQQELIATLRPTRVVDPLLWLLDEFNFLDRHGTATIAA